LESNDFMEPKFKSQCWKFHKNDDRICSSTKCKYNVARYVQMYEYTECIPKIFPLFFENASCFVWEQTHTSFMYKITVRPLDGIDSLLCIFSKDNIKYFVDNILKQNEAKIVKYLVFTII